MNELTFREIVPFFESAVTALGTNPNEIKRQENDVFCKCPICGDSRYGNKKRLHLYQKGTVININCFNGDCSVKNYTPYRFFKDFHQRTFNEFRNFYRKRFLLEIQKPKEPTLESIDGTSMGLFDVVEIPEPQKSFKPEIEEIVASFELTGNDFADIENFKKVVTKIKELGDPAFREFKEMMK